METDSRPQRVETEVKDVSDLPQPASDSLAPPPAGAEGSGSDDSYTEERQSGSDQGLAASKAGSLSSVRQSKRSSRRSVQIRSPAHAKGESSDGSMSDDTDGEWEPDEDGDSLLSTRKQRKTLRLRVGVLMDPRADAHTTKSTAGKFTNKTYRR